MKNVSYKQVSRREFLKRACIFGTGMLASPFLYQTLLKANPPDASLKNLGLREAKYYVKLDEKTVQCKLCPNKCTLVDGARSFCRTREPIDGKFYTLVYERPSAVHVDPIEKKPIFHMLPGSFSFSIATVGCNLRCKFCQNWQISQSRPEDTINHYLSCNDVVRKAEENRCRSIAYTYSEPITFYEYVIDTAKIAQSNGIKNVLVTAGYINREPLLELCNYIDAANVDLKAFDDKYLRDVCNQRLRPLLEAIKTMKDNGVWIEITNLVVPTLNDNMKTIRRMCAWIRENLGSDTPLHFSRFWPMYKLKNLPPTPVDTLKDAREVALSEGLHYAYIGNVPGDIGNNTFCPQCKKLLIKRTGYTIYENNITESKCRFCDYKISGIWK